MFPFRSQSSSQSAGGQTVLRAPQTLYVLVADGHKPDDDRKRIAGAALRQRKPGGPAARAELSFAHMGTSYGN